MSEGPVGGLQVDFTTELNNHGEPGRVLKTFHLSRGSFRSEELPVSEEHPRRDFYIRTVLDLAFSHNSEIKVHQSQDQSRDIREQHNRMIVRHPGEEKLGWTMVPKGLRSERRIKEDESMEAASSVAQPPASSFLNWKQPLRSSMAPS